MSKIIQTATLVLISLTLSACATSQTENTVNRERPSKVIAPPPEITFAPAIDVPYSEVIKDVQDHVGVNVRWGGQVIAAEEADGTATLTLIASPLDERGRPRRDTNGDFDGGRFIVEAYGYDISEGSRFITVYGTVSKSKVLTNGKLQKTIPIITAIDTVHWEDNIDHYVKKSDHYNSAHPHYSLGLGYGRGYSSYGYGYNRGYGRSYNRSYNKGYSSRHYGGYYGGHGRFGVNVFRGKNYRSGYGSSKYRYRRGY